MQAASRLDRLIIDEALAAGAGCPCDVVVLDDPEGALTRFALDLVGTHPDEDDTPPPMVLLASRDVNQARQAVTLAEDAGLRPRLEAAGIDGPLDVGEFLGRRPGDHAYALTRLPKSLSELDHLARATAVGRSALTFVGGGNTKHMARSQNDVLARLFEQVRAGLGQGKFRCLLAEGPVPGLTPAEAATHDGPDGVIHGVGGVFGGASPDRGGMLLAQAALADLAARGERPATILDLGCGNGSVSLAVLAALSEVRVIATDVASDAVVSARLTLAPHADRADVTWDDAAGGQPHGSVDVVLLNPPFHAGTRVDATLVQPLIRAAPRVLRPGGSMYFVHNSHLRYRPLLEARFDRVTQTARDATFTVLRADLTD